MKILIHSTYEDGYPSEVHEVADDTPDAITLEEFISMKINHPNYSLYSQKQTYGD